MIDLIRKRNASSPKGTLLDGVQILKPLLRAKGFRFRFLGEGKGSGGPFASGEFVHGDRRLEFHFRYSLGLVRYHVGEQNASHESYMRELGVWEQCQYPAFSSDPMSGFEGLLHDLGFADDFLDGTAEKLRRAAAKQEVAQKDRAAGEMARAVGDTAKIEQMHRSFRQEDYREVLRLAGELKYPNRLSDSENKMVEIAKKRSGLQLRRK